jgi:integrase
MRRSELAGTRRERVNLKAALLTSEPARVGVAGKAEDSDGKTESSQRVISLDSFTVEALRLHIERLDKEAAEFGREPSASDYLLCHPSGKPLHPDTITHRFNALVDRAGVPRIRLHDVRHTYATLCLDEGINPKIVSDRIGHASMAFTLTTYTHRTTGQDRTAAEIVASRLFANATEGTTEEPAEDEEEGTDQARNAS